MIKLLRFLKPYKLPIIAVLALVFLQTLSELYLPTLMSDIVDTGIVKGDTNYIIRIGGLMLLVTAVGTISSIVANFISSKVGVGFGTVLRSKVFSQVESFSLPLKFYLLSKHSNSQYLFFRPMICLSRGQLLYRQSCAKHLPLVFRQHHYAFGRGLV